MSFILRKGKVKTVYLPIAASVALVKNTLVTFSSGTIAGATSSTAAADIAGVIRKTIATTDSDYASAKMVPIDVPVERFTEWEADVTATLVVGDVGIEVDLTDSATVNRGATSVKAVRISKFLTTTKAWVWIKFMGAY